MNRYVKILGQPRKWRRIITFKCVLPYYIILSSVALCKACRVFAKNTKQVPKELKKRNKTIVIANIGT